VLSFPKRKANCAGTNGIHITTSAPASRTPRQWISRDLNRFWLGVIERTSLRLEGLKERLGVLEKLEAIRNVLENLRRNATCSRVLQFRRGCIRERAPAGYPEE